MGEGGEGAKSTRREAGMNRRRSGTGTLWFMPAFTVQKKACQPPSPLLRATRLVGLSDEHLPSTKRKDVNHDKLISRLATYDTGGASR